MSAFVWIESAATRARAIGAGAWLLAALALAAAGPSGAQTTNSIDSLSVSKGASGRTLVRFTLKAPPANPPAGFAIANPARVALDFLDTTNGLGRTTQEIADPALRSVNVVQVGNRTRVVLNLDKPQTFETQVEGNVVQVTLFDQSASLDVKAQTVQRFAENQPGDVQHALRDVDFRRGSNGEGRIIVELSDNSTGIDIRQQGKLLIVDFIGAAVPRNLERRLDVQDFATPVVSVDTLAQGGNARMIIEPKGLWEHSAYQADKRFILEVKAIQDDPNKLIQGSRQGYKGEKLSLNFQNVEVRAVLQVIADFTGLNIITSDSVTGNLTLRLKEIPWDQALDIIMQTKGLDMRKNGNIVLIAPREELALKEKQQLESQIQIAQLEPLLLESFQLNYMKASDFQQDPVDQPPAALRPGRRADGDHRRPGLDPVRARRRVRRPAHQHPVRAGHGGAPRRGPQDHPAARHGDPAGADRGADRDRQGHVQPRARHQAGGADRRHVQQPLRARHGRQPVHAAGRLVERAGLARPPAKRARRHRSSWRRASRRRGIPTTPQLNVNLPVTNVLGPAGSLALTLINLGSGNLINLELAALEADNRGKVVSSPRVVTGDNQKASIEQGTEIPYTTGAGTGQQVTTQFKKAVLRLDVVPQITPDNKIIMGVEVRKDSVGQNVQQQGGGSVPSIDTRNVITQIMVNNGDTAVIGGIFEENDHHGYHQGAGPGRHPRSSATCSRGPGGRRKRPNC